MVFILKKMCSFGISFKYGFSYYILKIAEQNEEKLNGNQQEKRKGNE